MPVPEVLPEVTVFPATESFPEAAEFPATESLPAAAVFPAAKPFPTSVEFPAPVAFPLFPEAAAPSFLLAAALSPVMIGSPTLSASLSLSPEILFSAFRSSGISSHPSAVSFETSSDKLPSPGMVSDQISSFWMVSGVLLRCQRAAIKITTRTAAARSNTGRAGMILPLCRFPKPTFRKPEHPSREPSSREPGLRPVSRPSDAVLLLFRSFIYRASPRKRFTTLRCDQLHFASLRCNLQSTAISSASLQSTTNCDQLRFTSLCCNLQPTPTNFATPLRFAATNFTSLHKFAATQGPATSRLSGSSL